MIRGQHEKEHAEHALEKRLIHRGGEVDGGGGGRGVDDEREDDLARADVLSVAQYHQRRQRDAHDAHDGGGRLMEKNDGRTVIITIPRRSRTRRARYRPEQL